MTYLGVDGLPVDHLGAGGTERWRGAVGDALTNTVSWRSELLVLLFEMRTNK
jgi:hypothetical protein